MGEQVFSYADYINKNPLYLHNSEANFKASLNQIPKVNYKSYMLRYIKYLHREEEKIIKALGGGAVGKNALQLLADEITNSNSNIKKTAKFMQDLFGVTGMGTVYVRANDSLSQGDSIVDLVYPGKDAWDKNPKREKISIKQNIFLTIPGSKINLIIKERLVNAGHGRPGNVYDYTKTLENLSEQQLKEFSEALEVYTQSLQKAFNEHNKILKNLGAFVNLEALKTKSGAENVTGTLQNYVKKMSEYDGTITEQWLEYLTIIEGMYNALKGKFNEASASQLSSTVLSAFGKGFSGKRSDQSTGKNKKPDMTYSGGLLNATLNPITVSMKQIDKLSEKYFKAHTASLLNTTGSEEDGIYELVKKESEIIGNILLYLSLNGAYFNSSTASTIIKNIYQYLSYVFLSGTNKDARQDQAVYFILTHGKGNNMIVKFLSMSDILINIYNASEKVFDPNLKDNKDEQKFNNMKKLKMSIFEERQKSINKGVELGYEVLYNNEKLKNCILDIAGLNVLYKTIQITLSTKYLNPTGIII